MKILLSGGGSGGHITPLLAVAHELKKLNPKAHIVYVGEKGGKFANLTEESTAIDEVRTVFAGKFRRYHGESWPKRLLDIKTNLLNLRDFFLFLLGTLQSLILLKRLKPDVVFLKGSFVGVPVGFASAFWHIPFVTHDSDATAGLANRIVSQWATYHATALPAMFYTYPKTRTKYVGVLVGDTFQAITPRLQARYKAELGVSDGSRLLLVTGGSLGAKRLNEAFRVIVEKLLKEFPDLVIVHQVGKSDKDSRQVSHPRLLASPFLQDMHRYSGAADVIVARAGANTLAELGVQGKAVIVVPNAQLAGGHQTKNAEKLASAGAVLMVKEKNKKQDALHLHKAIQTLLNDAKKRETLGQNLRQVSPTGAAHQLAMLLLEVEGQRKT